MVRAARVDDGIRSNLPCLLHSVKVLTITRDGMKIVVIALFFR